MPTFPKPPAQTALSRHSPKSEEGQFLPAALAKNTVESLYAEQGRQRPWIYWIILLACIAALVALPLIKVDITVRAPGIVRPAVERIELKVTLNGRISRVLVKDNERVTAGQPLLQLSTRDLDERLARNRTLQKEKTSIISDLMLLVGPDNTQPATTVLNTDQPELAEACFKTLEYRQSYLQARAQLDANRLTLAKARADLVRFDALANKGLISQSELDNARYTASNAEAQDVLLIRQALSNWKTLLRNELTARDDLKSDEARLLEEVTYSTVRAPVAGSIQSFLGYNEGGYVIAGQTLGFISPDTELLIETSVSPRDVGLIQPGQVARLQIDAFPYTQWGLLDARVEQIGEDANISNQQLSFRVLLKPEKSILRLPNGITGTLRKGMTLNARFVVNSRTLLQVLYEETADWINPQGKVNDT